MSISKEKEIFTDECWLINMKGMAKLNDTILESIIVTCFGRDNP